jgi:hypothetical protein
VQRLEQLPEVGGQWPAALATPGTPTLATPSTSTVASSAVAPAAVASAHDSRRIPCADH